MQPLPRSAVRLLPGPFLDAQATALEYLLSLDPDRRRGARRGGRRGPPPPPRPRPAGGGARGGAPRPGP
ncbi:hypothetical protein, partial [Streptomyces mirabilis]|uniref:hypothetical protein n=1 Tax=Streptomyces mirabilis TaxID=68239 RepID=UPI0036BA581F